ncbi:hypothetical protein DICVIV_09931 [Dictyocaulus viviparus]|uniref:Uncharacterized protein n=1 Tax=Dictyocaulus viviparus TaxID=29172 RepID=A0A0D8XJX8_DICVI|nr:hypothetical protein DICVIV_09931 [Dictyocaulus viviparus]
MVQILLRLQLVPSRGNRSFIDGRQSRIRSIRNAGFYCRSVKYTNADGIRCCGFLYRTGNKLKACYLRLIRKEYPTLNSMLSNASEGSPVVFIVNPNFTLAVKTLGQFSKEASAYTSENKVDGLPAIVKSVNYSERHFTDIIHSQYYGWCCCKAFHYLILRPDLTSRSQYYGWCCCKAFHYLILRPDLTSRLPKAKVLTSADGFVPNASSYVLSGEDWSNMQSMAEKVLPQLKLPYTAVITATGGISTSEYFYRFSHKDRMKRVVTSDMEDGDSASDSSNAVGADINMPLSLPPYSRSKYPDVKPHRDGLGSCLLYMEGVNIVVQNNKKMFATIPIRSFVDSTTWNYAKGDVQCSNSTVGDYRLVFTGNTAGYWKLSKIEVKSLVVEPVSGSGQNFISNAAKAESGPISTASVENIGLNSVMGFAMACSDSQAAFFKTDQEGVLIGISFYNTEIQTFATYPDPKPQEMLYFTRQVEDCIGTFSTGSWMEE